MGIDSMNPLFRYFAKRIIVDLHPSKFTFSIKEKGYSISFTPFLYLYKDEKIWLPIAIGEEIPAEDHKNAEIVRVDINDFGNSLLPNSVIDSESFLQLLLEYGIGRCFERFWLPQLRPIVFIFGVNQFNECFKNSKEMFELAARQGGAKYVFFDTIELTV